MHDHGLFQAICRVNRLDSDDKEYSYVIDLGEKCDEDEAAALKSGKPFVEHEPDGYDVTAPLHDANGKVIGTLGIDIRPIPGQTKKSALKITNDLLKEIEPQISSEASLFEPAS